MRRTVLFAVLTSLALVAVACSDSSEPASEVSTTAPIATSSTTSSTTTTASAPSTTEAEPPDPVELDIEMSDLTYEPGEITVALGTEVTITATNGDPFGKHDLVIVRDVFSELVQVKNAMKADPGIVVGELGLVEAGKSDSLIVTFDEPGVYQFFCLVTGHFVAGMQGTITVEG